MGQENFTKERFSFQRVAPRLRSTDAQSSRPESRMDRAIVCPGRSVSILCFGCRAYRIGYESLREGALYTRLRRFTNGMILMQSGPFSRGSRESESCEWGASGGRADFSAVPRRATRHRPRSRARVRARDQVVQLPLRFVPNHRGHLPSGRVDEPAPRAGDLRSFA